MESTEVPPSRSLNRVGDCLDLQSFCRRASPLLNSRNCENQVFLVDFVPFIHLESSFRLLLIASFKSSAVEVDPMLSL